LKNWRDYLLSEDATIRDAIVVLEKNQCAVIVDAEEHILGTITDRDIRRGLLGKVSIDYYICDVMNKDPTTLSFPLTASEIKQKLGKCSFEQFPVVDSQQKVVGLHTNQELMQVRLPNTVVLMAGGLGSRLSPMTEKCPKPLLKVGDQPVLETIIKGFIEHGFHRFVISVNYQSEMIENYFQDGRQWGASIDYLREKKALGTAGALSLLEESLGHPIIVMNGDLLTKLNFRSLLEFHQDHDALITMCVREYDFQVPYGVATLDGYYATALEEKPRHKFFVNAGVYAINTEVLSSIPENKFYNMTDLINPLLEKKRVLSFPIHEYWIDIGNIEDYHKAHGDYEEVFGQQTRQ
jgi:dTDP-glucose pyrophosphorylase